MNYLPSFTRRSFLTLKLTLDFGWWVSDESSLNPLIVFAKLSGSKSHNSILWFTGSLKCRGLAWLKWPTKRLVSSQAFRVSRLLFKEHCKCKYCRCMMYWKFLSHMKLASSELIFPEGITQPIQIFDVPRFFRWMIAKISFGDDFSLVQHLLHTCIQRAIVILSNRVTCCPVCIIQSIWNSFFLFFKPEQKKVLVEVVTLLLITMWVNIDGAIYCFTVDGESLLSLVTFTWDLLQRYSLSSPSLECHWKVPWWWV